MKVTHTAWRVTPLSRERVAPAVHEVTHAARERVTYDARESDTLLERVTHAAGGSDICCLESDTPWLPHISITWPENHPAHANMNITWEPPARESSILYYEYETCARQSDTSCLESDTPWSRENGTRCSWSDTRGSRESDACCWESKYQKEYVCKLNTLYHMNIWMILNHWVMNVFLLGVLEYLRFQLLDVAVDPSYVITEKATSWACVGSAL